MILSFGSLLSSSESRILLLSGASSRQYKFEGLAIPLCRTLVAEAARSFPSQSFSGKRGRKSLRTLRIGMAENGALAADYLAVAVEAARSAGEIIRRGFYQTKNVEHKGQVDLVTETDKACEELIFNHIRTHFPDHKFIGEEASAENGTADLTDDATWIVDPLDGTTNFVHGFPFVCVSIGLTIGKIPTVGVVYNPIMNELFTGVRGEGAFLNGNPMKVSSQTELVKSLLATEVGTKRDELTVDATTNRVGSLLFKVRSVRMSGSCALNLCGVACGRLDLFYELGFGGPWDIAAGIVIVQEAGGVVFDPAGGGELDIMSQKVAASNAHLKDLFVDALKDAEATRL